jgi:5-methyltetrahydropteroyltriglutamate--homocysteine methyltransferase
MLNYFWQKIPAFQGATQPKPITPHDPNVFHPAATCRARIQENIDLGLAEEFMAVSALTDKPVKITMTGPHMLAKVAYDEHYGDIAKMMSDIQIDEPLFTVADDAEVSAAVDTINMAIKDIPGDVHTSTHVCQGNYAVGKEYDAQIGHRYFDSGRYKADLVCKIETDSYLIEHDMTHHYEGLLGNHQLGVGAVDVQDPDVESGETVAARIAKYKWLAPKQTIITSSCGFNHLPRSVAAGKLRAMTDAKRILGG